VARGELEPLLGSPTRQICGFAGARSRPTLLCGDLFASSRQSRSVLLRELCAHDESVGGLSHCRCQASRRLPREIALACRVRPATAHLLTLLALFAPIRTFSLRVIRQSIALARFSVAAAVQSRTFAFKKRILGPQLCRTPVDL
jgi:hypothetical protein